MLIMDLMRTNGGGFENIFQGVIQIYIEEFDKNLFVNNIFLFHIDY